MKHPRIAGMIFNMPQMVMPVVMDSVISWAKKELQINIVNAFPSASSESADMAASGFGQRSAASDAGNNGVAVIPVHGILVSRAGQLNPCEVMTSYDRIAEQFQAALNDVAVEHIVFDIDSPGGSVPGCFELAKMIYEARSIKPTTAIVNYMACSAGYLIASACGRIIVSQTSIAGSIGVIAKHADLSAALDQQGVKITTVYAGAHKNNLSPAEPISELALQWLNDMVQGSYADFTAAVALYRGMKVEDVVATEAQVYFGQAIIDKGLADKLEAPQDAINGVVDEVAAMRAKRADKSRTRMQMQADEMAMKMAM
ncbi:S49 family peptidase [Leeia sp. TBRC 13508]|uniref:S49 family peptidase n=1 Tax=Leeia speluncae TaxID=2884804 RepID=A0ABS8D7W3_9NEIS|nr:S49 family peptidase [Leeia speluncae]MCB6184279.1 S49 family peptidase [Leeia speluncae]